MMPDKVIALLDAVSDKYHELGYVRLGLPAGLTPRSIGLDEGFIKKYPELAHFASKYELSGDEIGGVWFGSRNTRYEKWIDEFQCSYPVENGFVFADTDGFIVFMTHSSPAILAAWRWTDAPDGLPIAPDFNTFIGWVCEVFLYGRVPDGATAFADSELASWFWKELAMS